MRRDLHLRHALGVVLASGLLVTACEWRRCHDPSSTDVAGAELVPSRPDAVKALAGVWWRYEQGVEGQPLRFYYFHGDGKGLYRYGRIGHTMTNSFDYDVRGDELVLTFRKTGAEHQVKFRLELGADDVAADAAARDWLVLEGDPREPGTTRYFRERRGGFGEIGETIAPLAIADDELGPAPAGHMWIDHTNYATGGNGFLFYQFRPAGIDGRGVGWFHKGDFDDWSTESLTYRITGGRMELGFPLSNEHTVTDFHVKQHHDTRVLELDDDPRDFFHPHVYRDAGRSFGSLGAFAFVAGTAPWTGGVESRPERAPHESP